MISIVVPAYNEEASLKPLTEDLIKVMNESALDWELILVDDNSTDDTGRIADAYSEKYKNIIVIHRKSNIRGMGAALKEGTFNARGDVVVWVMGDRSDKISVIPKLVEKLEEGFDMALASRYMKGGSRGDLDVHKAMYGRLYSLLCRFYYGMPFHDITNAFRAFRKSILGRINIASDDFAISPELSIKAFLGGYGICEAPTEYYSRREGVTKFKVFMMGLRYLSLLKYKFV